MLNKNKLVPYILLTIVFTGALFFALPAQAEGVLWQGGTLEACRISGACKLGDFVQLAVNVAGWILGVTGSLALLAFVYGGILFLISAGSSERVKQGKQAIIGAVIGIVIVMASYMIIGFTFKALGVEMTSPNAWSNTKWFSSPQSSSAPTSTVSAGPKEGY